MTRYRTGWRYNLMDKAFIRLGIKPRRIFPAVRLAYLGERAWGALSFRPGIDDEHDREWTLDAR